MSIKSSRKDLIDISFIDRTTNYQKKLDKMLKNMNEVPTLLLHSCCGPCSSYVLEYLSEYFRITVFYYNPNIYPSSEYNDRIIEQKKVIENVKSKYQIDFIEGDYIVKDFYDTIKGLECKKEGEERCIECYKLRLKESAVLASKYGYDFFTTSLSISPHKDAHILNAIGNYYARRYNIKYLESDFKKKNGFKRSVEITNELNIYRQEYCGCIFSKKEMENKFKIKYALFGNPVVHSKSPIIHNLAFSLMGINAEYNSITVNSAEEIISICNKEKIIGANITTPFKEEIIKYLDEVDDEAIKTNSVNTIKVVEGKFYGFTTDGLGMLDLVSKNARSITVIGCGAAARSIVSSLSVLNIPIYIFSRRKSANYSMMVALLSKLKNNKHIYITEYIKESNYIINATTVGMNNDESIINDFSKYMKDTVFIDIIYKDKGKTKFVSEAENQGFQVYDGKHLLIKQANHSFNIWTGKNFDEKIIADKIFI